MSLKRRSLARLPTSSTKCLCRPNSGAGICKVPCFLWDYELFRIIIPTGWIGEPFRHAAPSLWLMRTAHAGQFFVRTCYRPHSISLKPPTTLTILLLPTTLQAEEPSCVVLAPIALPFRLPWRPRLLAPIPAHQC